MRIGVAAFVTATALVVAPAAGNEGAVQAPRSSSNSPETIMSVATRPGVTQSFVLVRPDRDPVGSVVLFSGGGGNLRLAQRRTLDGHTNFLVRNRQRFVAHGFVVAVVDAPSDRATHGLTLFRSTAGHAQDVQAVIEALRRLSPAPVWLVGTSMGTVSAANAAARLAGGPAAPDGLVLSSSVTRPSRRERESLSDVRLGAVAVPTLIVHHKDDACPVTPHRDAAGLARDLKAAPRVEVVTIEGGDPAQSAPCEPLSPHGFFGLDAAVVERIARWMGAP
jgi:pimeloyl-ACP methyl ester carboxylesterase